MAHDHNLHILPDDEGWKIVAPNQQDPIVRTATQEEAIDLATRMQYEDPEGGEVLVHGRDGQIRERNTINRKDPFPPRG